MKKFLLALLLTTCLGASAVSAPDPNAGFIIADNGDTLMPSLTELLGEEVDDFGDFDINTELKEQLVDYASKYLGTRYVRGGKKPGGFDCSGFTSYVFRNIGYVLSPSSRLQGLQGEHVDLSEVEVGDLMFFSGRRVGKTVGHVGMVVDVDREKGTCKFIHASTSQGVVVQSFPDGGYYSQRFLHARRILTEDFQAMATN